MFGFYSKEKLTNIGVSNQEDFGQTFPTPRETTATTTTTENLQPAVVKKAVPKNRSNKKRQPLGKSQLQLLVLFQIISGIVSILIGTFHVHFFVIFDELQSLKNHQKRQKLCSTCVQHFTQGQINIIGILKKIS